MSTVGDVSLAVIAAAAVVVAVFLVPVLLQVRRTALRAEEVLASVQGALLPLLEDLRSLVRKLDGVADTLEGVAHSVERLDRMAQRAVHTVDGVREAARRVVRDAVLPVVANAAGVLAALREGIQWIRPIRDQRRDEP